MTVTYKLKGANEEMLCIAICLVCQLSSIHISIKSGVIVLLTLLYTMNFIIFISISYITNIRHLWLLVFMA